MIHRRAAVGHEPNASIYATARPAYHPDLVSTIIEEFGTESMVELGAGTGIFTRQLVQAGCRPIAVEPVDAMRSKLREALPTVRTVAGTAEWTGLPAGGAATVIASQAFHWFDHGKAPDEIARILRPGVISSRCGTCATKRFPGWRPTPRSWTDTRPTLPDIGR